MKKITTFLILTLVVLFCSGQAVTSGDVVEADTSISTSVRASIVRPMPFRERLVKVLPIRHLWIRKNKAWQLQK